MTNDEAQEPSVPLPRDTALSAPDFFICTSPEMDALERAAADGKHGLHYQNSEQEAARIHQIHGASHFVRLELTEAEEREGIKIERLETLTAAQDADATLAFLYISRLLAPPAPLPPNAAPLGWVDFNDVIAKIGWEPRSSTERREMHARLYNFLLFGERAQVIGARRGRYLDKYTKQEIRTTVRSPLWRVAKTEWPEQQSLYPELETNAPVRVQLVILGEWGELLTQPQTAQYLPMGELLGAIPGSKPSGAWARVIGLALASFWRRLPRETQDGTVKPTRRELIDRYTPKTGSVASVLSTHNPQYVVNYWCAALQILVKAEFVKDVGETKITPSQMRASLPRQNWSDEWLNATVDIQPGPVMVEALKHRVAALPVTPVRKRGRPKKKVD